MLDLGGECMPSQQLLFSSLVMHNWDDSITEDASNHPTSPQSPDAGLDLTTFGGNSGSTVYKIVPSLFFFAGAITDSSPSINPATTGYYSRRIFVSPPLFASSIPEGFYWYMRMRGYYTITNPIAPEPVATMRWYGYIWKADNTKGADLFDPIDATTDYQLDTFANMELNGYGYAVNIADGDRLCFEVYDHVHTAGGGGTKFGLVHGWGAVIVSVKAFVEFPFEDDGDYIHENYVIITSGKQIRAPTVFASPDAIASPDQVFKVGF